MTLWVGEYAGKCAEFFPENDCAFIFTIGQLLRLIFVKTWKEINGKKYKFTEYCG